MGRKGRRSPYKKESVSICGTFDPVCLVRVSVAGKNLSRLGNHLGGVLLKGQQNTTHTRAGVIDGNVPGLV